jgi:hypothetical protein
MMSFMYRHNRRRHKNAILLVGAVILASLLGLQLLRSVHPESKTTILASDPKSVWGYVYDEFGDPVNGAHVNVSIWTGSTFRSAIEIDTIDPGFYEAVFASAQWDVGNIIKVTATWGSLLWLNTTVAVIGPDQNIDLSLVNLIPEFGGQLSVTPVVVASVMVLLLVFRRKPRQPSGSSDF